MSMLPRIPLISLLGFGFGCCLAVIIAILFIPANNFWPSTNENRLVYLQDLIVKYHFSYLESLQMYKWHMNSQVRNISYETEIDYLRRRVRILCYCIEEEADDETHASLMVTTWGMHCDKTIMFYSSSNLISKIHPRYIRQGVLDLVYVDYTNSTMTTLLDILKSHVHSYEYFTYVPPYVFLIPDNLRYYLLSSKIDPDSIAFSGRPDFDKLFGSWSISESSPLAISRGAVVFALNSDNTKSFCHRESIQGRSFILSI